MQPQLILVGSAAEGTRVGLANEMDFMMMFEAWREDGLKTMPADPFHLYATENTPSWLKHYFNAGGQFELRAFLADLLRDFEAAVDSVFISERKPQSLLRVTTNAKFASTDCVACCREKADPVVQACPNCAVTISQTKVGVCLQFEWISNVSPPLYCSVDVIPAYKVVPIEAVTLARMVNSAMLAEDTSNRPVEWYRYLRNYTQCDMVLEDIMERDVARRVVSHVFLKTMHACSDASSRSYYVRPGQLLGVQKFQNMRFLQVYRYIKCLKRVYNLENLNLYMTKKILLKPSFLMDLYGTVLLQDFLLKIVSHPALRHHFEKSLNVKQLIERSLAERGTGNYFSRFLLR